MQFKRAHVSKVLITGLLGIFTCFHSLAADADSTIVIYLSGSNIQVGMAGESSPRINMPAVVGLSASPGPMIGMGSSRTYYGQEALNKTGIKKVYTVKNSQVTDWKNFEKLMHHIFYQKLRITPEDYAVIINEPASKPATNREKMIQVFFETFNVQAYYMTALFGSWAQASQVAARSTFQEMFVTKDEYDEVGPEIIHRKSR